MARDNQVIQEMFIKFETRQVCVQGPISQRDLSPDLDLNLRLWS